MAKPPTVTTESPVVAATNVPTAPTETTGTILVSVTPTVATPPAPVALATNAAVVAPPIPAVTEPPIKRVVTREGVLKGMTSIQAPSFFELRTIDNNRLIEYVWSPTTNIVLKPFKGKKVLVTGEELLDERWPNTPVITVESIDLAP